MVKTISQDQLALFRSRLEDRRSKLHTAMQDEKSTPVRTESDSQDIELSYVSELDQKLEVEINGQHSIELRDIEAALQRMDNGHYGVCQDCGAVIDNGRLSAYPTARRCIECKRAFEWELNIARHT